MVNSIMKYPDGLSNQGPDVYVWILSPEAENDFNSGLDGSVP